MPLLQVEDLSIRFKTEETESMAVNAICFSLQKGETLGLVGESGSGKSVTSLAIMGLIPRFSGKVQGRIQFNHADNGVDLLGLDDDQMREYRGKHIGMIFQEPMTSLNPSLTCGYQVAEVIRLHNQVSKEEAKKQTIALFEEVQLPRPEQVFNTYPHEISGGQKQRVMIAMAISCNPQLLIADEPTTALDVTVQKTILQLLDRLKKERGMSMIFISHDLGVVSEVADQVVVMYQGNIVEKGTVKDVFTHPQHAYTKGLLACRPAAHRQVKRLPVVSDFMQVDDNGEIVETGQSIDEVKLKYHLSQDEIKKREVNLYSQEPLLSVKGLKTWFPIKKGIFSRVTDHVKAVNDVSFDVFPGETLGLVGESGCGKTTLGRSILRLMEPSGGQVDYDGKNLTHLSPNELRAIRKDIQIIFQDPYSSLNPRLTIGQSILEPLKVHRLYANDAERKAKVMELMEKVSLPSTFYNRYPHEFSGGQRQRACIARALALRPRFIICDESVSALDVSVQAQVLNLLMDLREEFQLTYIFISHDLSVVRFISDRIAVMKQGRIEELGSAEQIYENPQSDYTRSLIAAIPKGELRLGTADRGLTTRD